MGGARMRKAGEALELFVRSLPNNDTCFFNVIGYGTRCEQLFTADPAADPAAAATAAAVEAAEALEAPAAALAFTW